MSREQIRELKVRIEGFPETPTHVAHALEEQKCYYSGLNRSANKCRLGADFHNMR